MNQSLSITARHPVPGVRRSQRWLMSATLALSVALTTAQAAEIAAAAPASGLAADLQFIYSSDAHYGIKKATAFQTAAAGTVDAQIVNAAMVAQMNKVPAMTLNTGDSLDANGGVGIIGNTVGAIDFVIHTGDIANRQESAAPGIQSSATSWAQFQTDYLNGLTVKTKTNVLSPMYLLPGNHEVSNAIGYYKAMTPTTDATAIAEIFNRMPGSFKPATPRTGGLLGTATYNYATDKVHYSIDSAGVHFVFVNMWPDSGERAWLASNLASVAPTTPVVLFTHDQPDAESKHFTNPNGTHTINSTDKFENLLVDQLADGATTSFASLIEQRAFVAFLKKHPNITAYFHGNTNYNQFYTYNGPDGDVALNTIRVDSPLKGEATVGNSGSDEKKLSFQVVSINAAAKKMSVRECLWNPTATNGAAATWGSITTLNLVPRPGFSTNPTDRTVTWPNSTTFSVVATDPAATLQWQSKIVGGVWTDVGGETNTTYTRTTTTVADDGMQFRCLATNSSGMTGSTVATLLTNTTNHAPAFLLGADTVKFTGTEVKVAQDLKAFDSKTQWGYYFGGATDSASSGTAFAAGYKTDGGALSWLPAMPVAGVMTVPTTGGNRAANDGSLKTIAEVVREGSAPKAIGVVSTVEFDHATPAVFVSHNKKRGNYWELGDEIINVTKPDVVIGAGHPGWEKSYQYLGPKNSTTDASNYIKLKDGSAGYTFVERKAGVTTAGADLLAAANSATKLFGLYGGLTSSGGYFEEPLATGTVVNGKGGFSVGSAENPSLADAATAAMKVLAKNQNGCFLMVEGGDIDWANHVDNFKWMLGAMNQFDEALRVGVSLVDAGTNGYNWNDTLFIVTADHGNSFMRLDASKPMGLGALPPMDANGIPTDGSVLFGGQAAYSATPWNSHTNEMTNFYARGQGAELFDNYTAADKTWYAPGIIDQTHLFEVMKAAATRATNPAKHIILWIPDGMQKAHEVAYNRYRYGTDTGLPWDAWTGANVRKGYVATWDVTGYNQRCFTYADPANPTDQTKTAPVYDRTKIEANADLTNLRKYAQIGYDVARGDVLPHAFVSEDSSIQRDYFLSKFGSFATRIDANDVGQTVTFTCTPTDPTFFSTPPALDAKGHLTFKVAAHQTGSMVVTAKAQDDGGTALPGSVDTTTKTFTITVAANVAPSFIKGANVTVAPAAPAQTIAGWATAISAGGGATQTLTFTVTADNTALFSASAQPALDSTGKLTFTPSGTAGTANCTVTLKDDGGTANGGVDTSAPQTFTITAGSNVLPTVMTTGALGITATGATAGGNVTADGGATVTNRGLCWSLLASPTTVDLKTTDGTGTGAYASTITGVAPKTTYHIRAYATNAVGTAYGSDLTFTTTAGVVATPVFSVAEGSYTSSQSVTITTATTGAAIYYTLDGSVPTVTSSTYSAPLAVATTTTVKAIAIKTDFTNSAVASATYTITNGTSAVLPVDTSSSNGCGMGSGAAALGLLGLLVGLGHLRRPSGSGRSSPKRQGAQQQ